MIKSPSFRKRHEFINAQNYLRAHLPKYPRLPPATWFFQQSSETDATAPASSSAPEAAYVDIPSTRESSKAHDSSQTSTAQNTASDPDITTRGLTPVLVEEMAAVWLLTIAMHDAPPLHPAGGLYVLLCPDDASSSSGVLETVLNHTVPDANFDLSAQPGTAVLDVVPDQIASDSSEGPKTATKSPPLAQRVRSKLAGGTRVFLRCHHEREIPEDLAALVLRIFKLSAAQPDMIYALYSLIYPSRPPVPLSKIPEQQTLSKIKVSDLALALCYADSTEITETLVEMARSPRIHAEAENTSPTLDELVGNTSAVALGLQIKQDFDSFETGVLPWAEVPNGILLTGPPGCGKTLVAQALARTLGAKLFEVSHADCATGHNRGSSGITETLFNYGRQAAACKRAVLFIDEIDGFGQSRFGKQDHNSSYFRTLTTSLLRFCDDMRKSKGVILIAATNDRAAVDPALLRAGRFDHHITLPAPRLVDVEALLSRELPSLSMSEITHAAQHLLGSSFADIDTVARKVKSHARAEGRSPHNTDLTHFLNRLMPNLTALEEDFYRIALHEAGHVIVDYVQVGQIADRVVLSSLSSNVSRHGPLTFTEQRLENELALLLAGRAAERLVLGDVGSGAGAGRDSDLARATQLVLAAQHRWHLTADSDLIWQEVSLDPSAPRVPNIEQKTSLFLRACERAAHDILARHRSALLTFANALLENREMHRPEIQSLLRDLIPNWSQSGPSSADPASTQDGSSHPAGL